MGYWIFLAINHRFLSWFCQFSDQKPINFSTFKLVLWFIKIYIFNFIRLWVNIWELWPKHYFLAKEWGKMGILNLDLKRSNFTHQNSKNSFFIQNIYPPSEIHYIFREFSSNIWLLFDFPTIFEANK